jgi:hypothetical protein
MLWSTDLIPTSSALVSQFVDGEGLFGYIFFRRASVGNGYTIWRPFVDHHCH